MAFVEAVNSNGQKQMVPEHWLTHPVFGKSFRLPPSAVRTVRVTPPPEEPAGDEKSIRTTRRGHPVSKTPSARAAGDEKAKATAKATDNAPAAGDKED